MLTRTVPVLSRHTFVELGAIPPWAGSRGCSSRIGFSVSRGLSISRPRQWCAARCSPRNRPQFDVRNGSSPFSRSRRGLSGQLRLTDQSDRLDSLPMPGQCAADGGQPWVALIRIADRTRRPGRATVALLVPIVESRPRGGRAVTMLMIQSGRAGSGGFSLGTGVSYPCCSVLGMEESTDQTTGRAAELIDALVLHHRELSKAQARCAALMMEFSETRSACDRQVIADRRAAGVDPRYKAGEFAGTEISMALRESKHSVQHTMVIARQLRKDTPDAWDAWQAGDITYDKAERISRTLGKLVRDNSKALLNHVVVDVAVCKTGELLGRWLNQFVARVEPDEQDERIHRSLADRYVSVRPDLDGVSFLRAALSSLDAASIDRVLTAIAAVADPGDTRTLQQRRADALVDVLLGRISNGWHTRWDGLDDDDLEDDGVDDNGCEDNGFDDTFGGDVQDGAARDGAQNGSVVDGEAVADGGDSASDQEPTPADATPD